MSTSFCMETLDALASANELSTMIIMALVGEELADSIAGSPLTRAQIFAMVQSKIQAKFALSLAKEKTA